MSCRELQVLVRLSSRSDFTGEPERKPNPPLPAGEIQIADSATRFEDDYSCGDCRSSHCRSLREHSYRSFYFGQRHLSISLYYELVQVIEYLNDFLLSQFPVIISIRTSSCSSRSENSCLQLRLHKKRDSQGQLNLQ